MKEVIEVNLVGVVGVELEKAYEMVKEIGAADCVLHIDERMFASSLLPRHLYKFSKKKPSVGALTVADLRMRVSAIEAAKKLIDSGLLSDKEAKVPRPKIKDVKAAVKTTPVTEDVAQDEGPEKEEKAPELKSKGRPSSKTGSAKAKPEQ